MKWIAKKLPAIIVVLLLTLLVAYSLWPVPMDVDVALVGAGSLELTVNDDGETRTREKFVVSAPVAGKLLRVQIHAGDLVRLGETELARILPSIPAPLDARQQAELEARLKAAEASLQLAESNLDMEREALELSQHHFDRARQLIAQNAVSKTEFDTLEHRLRISEANVRSGEFGIRVARFELEQCKAAVSRYDVGRQEESHEQASAIRLVSPIHGRVLRVFQEDAGIVAPATPLLELGDVTDLEIVVDVLSSESVKIRPGDRVYIDHWGGAKSLEAVVRLVEPSAFLKVSALGVEEKRVNVIADFLNPWEQRESLGDGFRVEAKIVVDSSSPNSLRAPSSAVFRQAGDWKAFRIRDRVAELVTLEVGLSNGMETEVIKGLAAGDHVVIYPSGKLKDGGRVRINEVR